MGGIFGKGKRSCVLPQRVTFRKVKGKKASRSVPMFCDAATWTGENHFHSARIGRTPKGPEPPAAAVKMVLAAPGSESVAQADQETGEQAPSLPAPGAEASLSAPAGDAQEAEEPQEPEAKASPEVVQHQELSAQEKQEANPARRSPQEKSRTGAALHPAGSCSKQLSCGDHEVEPLTQTTVKAEVHVSADVQGGAGRLESALAESELLPGAEQEAGVVCDSGEPCVGKTQQEAAVREAVDSSAALCTTEEPDLPLKTAETREGTAKVQRPAEEGGCCAPEASPDLQQEEDTKAPTPEDGEESAVEPEQAEEQAEGSGDGQASKATPGCLAETQAALQAKQKMKAGTGGTAGEL
ncbi:myristoylated alanine-rich C-kinase substrate-like [Melanerpes formicivorus]|uniref:myristoylated alanine-rich C-kinase substrate-like n=1 Tax=Melanerpes formicivorus TaxID=211600 RepID=UPI00358E0756